MQILQKYAEIEPGIPHEYAYDTFLEWQPCHSPLMLIQENLPRIFPMFTLRLASFPIPCFKLNWEWPSFKI